MSAQEMDRLTRENAYLKQRCAQLQESVTDLGGQMLRLEQQLERLHSRRTAAGAPDPLSGGQ